MVAICLYFQVHQPKRLRKYTYFDIGNSHFYEDDAENKAIMQKVAQKCYLPTNALLLELIHQHQGAFKVAYSLTGVFIEQCKRFCPEVLESFQRLAATGQVEFLNETYYHSLSSVFSPDEFKRQVAEHRKLIQAEFGYTATTFRNTELIYNNTVAKYAEEMGYSAILAEGADKILGWRSANFVYQPQACQEIRLLLRNYCLTDDIAFRFSEKSWPEYPVYAEKYASWLHALHGQADIINLFMDFETFGEHQWSETGIFEFLKHLPDYILRHPEYYFVTPAEAAKTIMPVAHLDVPEFMSWADVDRDLSAWRGNNMQEDALQAVYRLEKDVYATEDVGLIHTWQALLTSDHFYYMCTKYFADGDVHKYFSPYRNPYEAYINYQNVLSDFALVVAKHKKEKHLVTTLIPAENFLVGIWRKLKQFFLG